MPIDIDQLKLLVKVATAVPQDKGSQAMAAAAQAAKPAGGIPLPKTIEEESPAEGALSAEQQQREQEKLEQQRRKEIEAKENEIRGLQHELDLERVERQKMTNRHELDMQVRQEEARLKAEKDKLEKERFQLVQEKARQDNLFKAEEMKHQATLDKATYKQEAEIAKAQAKSTADLAKQQAQSLIATNDKARKASDKYYADASARLTKEHPSISPALQSQLDGAIASLNRFRKVHNKQTAIPKPGTPPDFTKLAMVKWAELDSNMLAAILAGADGAGDSVDLSSMSEDEARGVVEGGSAYDAIRAAAHFANLASEYQHKGDTAGARYYTNMSNNAKRVARINYNQSTDEGDKALYESYLDTKSTINGLASHKDYHTEESQFDRDSNAYKDSIAQQEYNAKGGPSWLDYLYDYTLGAIYSDAYNGVTNAAAGYRNASRFGANRFWNTTFDDPALADAYYRSIAEQGYSDSVSMDAALAAGGVIGGALSVTGGGRAIAGLGKMGLRAAGNRLLAGAGRGAATAAARRGATQAGAAAARGAAGSAAESAAGAAGRAVANSTDDVARAAGKGVTNGATGTANNTANGAVNAAANDVSAVMGGSHGGMLSRVMNKAKSSIRDSWRPYEFKDKRWYKWPGHAVGRTFGNAFRFASNPMIYYPEEAARAAYSASQPYEADQQVDNEMLDMDYVAPSVMNKSGSALIPVPGAAPALIKSGYNMTAQLANDYYDNQNMQNPSFYKDPYSASAKFLGNAVKYFTNGNVNPIQQVSRYDMYLNPRLPVSGTNLMQRVVYDTGQTNSSNIHTVIDNAARAKHGYNSVQPTNAATYRPQTTAGRSFATQLSEALT